MKTFRVYSYQNCSTCKKALKFLQQKKISYDEIAITDRPPTKAELKKMLGYLGGNLKKLFNTSGQVYRELKLGDRLAGLSEDEALDLLASNGKLIKRPFLLGDHCGTVGFQESEWSKLLKS